MCAYVRAEIYKELHYRRRISNYIAFMLFPIYVLPEIILPILGFRAPRRILNSSRRLNRLRDIRGMSKVRLRKRHSSRQLAAASLKFQTFIPGDSAVWFGYATRASSGRRELGYSRAYTYPALTTLGRASLQGTSPPPFFPSLSAIPAPSTKTPSLPAVRSR